MFAAISCFGKILSFVKPGTVLTSKRYGVLFSIINSLLVKPFKFNSLKIFIEIDFNFLIFLSSNFAGVISSDFPSYFAE